MSESTIIRLVQQALTETVPKCWTDRTFPSQAFETNGSLLVSSATFLILLNLHSIHTE